MSEDKFEWTDELVLVAIDLAHHNGYHKFKQRCVDVFDEVKEQAMKGGYKYSQWIIDHVQSKQQPKEYEIQCIQIEEANFWVQKDGLYNSSLFGTHLSCDWLLANGGKIHSVKRLSDSEVFSINEITEQGKIIRFGYSKESGLHVYIPSENINYTYPYKISEISKVKQPIPLSKHDMCNICGGELVFIRGKVPHSDYRQVCPTCNTERLEQINEISSKFYGVACKVDETTIN